MVKTWWVRGFVTNLEEVLPTARQFTSARESAQAQDDSLSF